MKMRKLMNPKLYTQIQEKLDMGVPLTKVMKQLDITMSHPACSKLMRYFEDSRDYSDPDGATIIHNSLFPKWLDADGPTVQEQPFDYKYIGYFPYGEWVHG